MRIDEFTMLDYNANKMLVASRLLLSNYYILIIKFKFIQILINNYIHEIHVYFKWADKQRTRYKSGENRFQLKSRAKNDLRHNQMGEWRRSWVLVFFSLLRSRMCGLFFGCLFIKFIRLNTINVLIKCVLRTVRFLFYRKSEKPFII